MRDKKTYLVETYRIDIHGEKTAAMIVFNVNSLREVSSLEDESLISCRRMPERLAIRCMYEHYGIEL